VGQHTPLTPAFTPEVCRHHIEWLHWGGWEDAEELLEQARQDLAYSRGVEGGSLSEEEVQAFADSQYFTPNRVNALLDTRYQQPQVLPLEEVEVLCRRHALHNTLRAARCLMTLRELEKALPERSRHIEDEGDGYPPFGALISLPNDDETDLVGETFEEYAQMVWQSGEFDPVYALAFDPKDASSIATLKAALLTSKRILKTTNLLFGSLEVISCLFP
ncbi:MAG: hypothetical protein M3511_14435, partial [Deinococcota bacterium]|nr:hypothetical protein [Deinococcota bacterium]